MSTLQCTNPNCQELITLPEGAIQVICPVCNTWHFPEPSEMPQQQNGFQHATPNPNYMPPPPSAEYQIPPIVGVPENGELLPPSVEEPIKESINEQKENAFPINGACGYLIGLDGKQFSLKEGKNIIGRRSGDVIINDMTVSRRHCVIEVTAKATGRDWDYIIYDIGQMDDIASTNGVFISGRSMRLQNYERIPIKNDSSIKLGNVLLMLKVPTA